MNRFSQDMSFQSTEKSVSDRFKLDTTILWKTAMLTVHVEDENEPDLRSLGTRIDDCSVHRVSTGPDDSCDGPESVLIIDEDEMVIALSTGKEDEGNATITVSFELKGPRTITVRTLADVQLPSIFIRGEGHKSIMVLSEDEESVTLETGNWILQAAALPGSEDRIAILELTQH